MILAFNLYFFQLPHSHANTKYTLSTFFYNFFKHIIMNIYHKLYKVISHVKKKKETKNLFSLIIPVYKIYRINITRADQNIN